MEILTGLWHYAVPFLIVLTILVFVHEWGHYWVARRCGVRVEVFSFGMGPELWGWNDREGTRWRISLLPLGGYVKMFGDSGAASTPRDDIAEMTPEEKAVSFHHQSLAKRAAIVAAGPVANFLFAVVVLALLFMTAGQPFTPPDIGGIKPGSAAEAAGLMPGDVILTIDGRTIERFEEVRSIVSLAAGQTLTLTVRRGDQTLTITAVPQSSPVTETWDITTSTLTGVGQMIAGVRGTDDLGGPLRIAQMSGEVAQTGVVALVWFLAVLSVNLGLINLFPIPLLDGGHLLFYGIEAMLGRPLDERTQEYGFRIGLALVLSLMVFATWNDLVHLKVVALFRGLIS